MTDLSGADDQQVAAWIDATYCPICEQERGTASCRHVLTPAVVVPRPGPLWEGPAFDIAVTQMRLVLMGTGALTLDQIDRHAPGLTRAVVGAYLAAIDTGAVFVRPYIDHPPAPAPNGPESDQPEGPVIPVRGTPCPNHPREAYGRCPFCDDGPAQ